MEKAKFNALLILVVQQLVAEIANEMRCSALDATRMLYASQLYAALEDESTKLWHLSPKALYTLFAEERETGQITYPEEA